MSSALARVITLKHLKDVADDRSFQRGQVYCVGGQVRSLVVHGDTLNATVCGTEDYVMRLVAGDEGLEHQCSCPVGAEGSFCKHGVAVALAWLGANAKGGGTSKKRRETATESSPLVSLDDLRPWLLSQTPATLTGYLLEASERDERLREKLLRGAARASAKGIDLAAYRHSVERATRTTRFIDYRSVAGSSREYSTRSNRSGNCWTTLPPRPPASSNWPSSP
ncbi:MAG: SWIM zinc finger family protein [Opitutaceae bacterium]